MSEKMTEIITVITNMTTITHTTEITPTTKTRATTSAQACLLLARQAEQTVMLSKTGAGSSRHLRNTPEHIRSRKTMNPTPNNRIIKFIDNYFRICYIGGKSSVLRVPP
jgi:hypothetical protein